MANTDKQLLHRYILRVVKDANVSLVEEDSEKVGLEVVASFYRGSIDPSYKLMVGDMIDAGLFDAFIAAVLQGLVHQGEFTILENKIRLYNIILCPRMFYLVKTIFF